MEYGSHFQKSKQMIYRIPVSVGPLWPLSSADFQKPAHDPPDLQPSVLSHHPGVGGNLRELSASMINSLI